MIRHGHAIAFVRYESRPKRVKRLATLTVGCAIGLVSTHAAAATLTSNGSASDTQSKIAAASNGDTVQLPASGTFTWTGGVSLPSTRAITLDLNGRTVTLSGAGGQLEIQSSDQGLGGVNRITNGTVVRGAGYNPYSGPFKVSDTRSGVGLRVDHVTFTGNDVVLDVNAQGAGVIDSCTFTGLSWAQEFIHILGWGASSTTGWTTDSSAAIAGTGAIFYIEDSKFIQNTSSNGVAWIQGYYGARVAIRHNQFDWVSVDMHGTAGNIGARWWELYSNTFDNDSSSGQPSWAFSLRAGSGVIFENKMAASAGHAVSIGLCEEDSGYPASYQIGRGINQSLDPAYVWNNSGLGLSLNGCDAPEQPGMVQLNRDVYASARPGYTPYTYPHPLRGGGPADPPDGGPGGVTDGGGPGGGGRSDGGRGPDHATEDAGGPTGLGGAAGSDAGPSGAGATTDSGGCSSAGAFRAGGGWAALGFVLALLSRRRSRSARRRSP